MPNVFELNLKIEHNLDRLQNFHKSTFKGGNNQSIATQFIKIEITPSLEVLKFASLNSLITNVS